MIVTIMSGKGSPGATTTAVALTLVWPQPILLVEADPAGASIAFGYGRGLNLQGRGLVGMRVATRHTGLVDAIWANVVALDETRWLLAGIGDPRQVATVDYPALARALAGIGVDVIIDAGRCPGPGSAPTLWPAADRILVALRATLSGVHTAQVAATGAAASSSDHLRRIGSVIIGPGRPYPSADVSAAMGEVAPVVGTVAWDCTGAAVISDGAPSRRKLAASPLLRSASRLARTLIDQAGATSPGAELGSGNGAPAAFIEPGGATLTVATAARSVVGHGQQLTGRPS